MFCVVMYSGECVLTLGNWGGGGREKNPHLFIENHYYNSINTDWETGGGGGEREKNLPTIQESYNTWVSHWLESAHAPGMRTLRKSTDSGGFKGGGDLPLPLFPASHFFLPFPP